MSDLGKYKLVILGEGRVGKTSLLMRYFKKIFNDNEKSTVNPSFYEKTENHKGKKYEFKFWDTAGQERYNALNAIYYQNAVGALIVYDVTIPETFNKVKDWVNTLREIVDKNIIFVIAGNKFDLSDKNTLSQNQATVDAYCAKENCNHVYTSAKTGYNVDQVFEDLINKVLIKESKKSGDGKVKRKGKGLQISSNTKKEKDKKNCC